MTISGYLSDSAEAIARLEVGEIDNAILMIKRARDNDHTVWMVGNGGSAATAEHFAGDLVKVGNVKAIAVNSLLPHILAYGNDNGWERMYADLLGALMRDGDVLVAISCSGKSANVLNAAALFHHNRLIVMTGQTYDSPLAAMEADAKIFVLDGDIRIQEDAHLAACHVIAGALRYV